MPVPIPPATPSTPPVAPQRTEPTTFSARMDAWLAWFNASFWVWVYDLVPWIQARANETEAWSNTASASAAAASVSQTTAEEAITVATTAMVTVTQQAAAAAATSATVSSLATAASTSATSASASSTAAAVSAGRAIAAWAAAAAPTEQLASMSQSLHVGTVVKSIIYDTSKDSDGGAWRKRMQDKSWYNETLGGNAWIGQQPSEAVARAYVGSLASPELIVNGTFDTDTSGWSISASVTAAVVSGQMRVTNTTDGGFVVERTIATTIGQTYILSASLVNSTGRNVFLRAATASGGGSGVLLQLPSSASANLAGTFVATSTSTWVSCGGSSLFLTGEYYDIDNISVKIVDPVIPTADYLYQSTADGKFYKTVSTSGVSEVFRGITREFPAVVAIVAESGRVVIYDLTQASCPMWMVFIGISGANTALLRTGNSSLAALNGALLVGSNGSVSDNMLVIASFVSDSGTRIFDTSAGRQELVGGLATRNLILLQVVPGLGLVSRIVNGVALTVLDTAPIDPATGLPVPTIYAFTSGGVSRIADDGTLSSTASLSVPKGFIEAPFVRTVASSVAGAYPLNLPLPAGNAANAISNAGFNYARYSSSVIPASLPALTSGVKTNFGCGSGLTVVKENPSLVTSGLAAHITNTYNSGWMVGDIRGAYLADTVAETIAASGELVLTPDFATDTNWIKGTGWTIAAGVAVSDGTGSTQPLYQATATTSGGDYAVTFTVTAYTSGSLKPRVGNVRGSAISSTGTFTQYLVSDGQSVIGVETSTTFNGTIDNISVKLAEPDRSVKNKGLVINGTLTKTAVASGAGLVAYSGFDVDANGGFTDCLGGPDSTLGPVLTSDFCVMGWLNYINNGVRISTAGPQGSPYTGITGTGIILELLANERLTISNVAAGVRTGATSGIFTPSGGVWQFYLITRVGDLFTLYLDSVSVASVTFAATAVGTGLWISNTYSAADMALWRFSATAPSEDQIAHIYRTELPLFQANAQCTLAGTSTAVTALAYDDVADELHVGTSWGRSEFKDLLRVASEATTTGSITSLSANEGVVLTGGTSAKVYAPAMYLRDELRRKDVARKALGRIPVFFDYTATASQTEFVAPKGYTIKALYKNGTLMRETTTGTYWARSHDGFQETATLSVGASVSDWVSIMCVRS